MNTDELFKLADDATVEDWQLAKLRIDTRLRAADLDRITTRPESAGPTLNASYWFKVSQQLVENASTKRVESAKAVQTMIGWFWGVYSAGAIIGMSLSDKSFSLLVVLLVASPIPILLIAYWLAIWAQVPISVEFDHRVPKDIKNSYDASVEARSQRLRLALGTSFIAALFVAFALVVGSISNQENDHIVLGNGFLLHHKQAGNKQFLLIDGKFHNVPSVKFLISANSQVVMEGFPQTVNYTPDSSGSVFLEIPMPPDAEYVVKAEWRNKDMSTQTLHREIVVYSENNGG